MTPPDKASPPPRGAGVGGGGRQAAGPSEGLAAQSPPSVASGDISPARGESAGRGWAPAYGEMRQKDFTRTKLRARRMRKEVTPSEKKLWQLLREIEGAHFRKQIPVDQYVFDFGDYSARLLIEVDGSIHRLPEVQANDRAKEIHAVANGFRLLRFANNDVWDRPAWVVERVRGALHGGLSERPSPLTPPREGEGDR